MMSIASFVFRAIHATRMTAAVVFCTLAALPFTGCQTASSLPGPTAAQAPGALAPGDTLNISFPGAPELNQVQKIRADGKISLPMIGDVDAAGKRLSTFQSDLAGLYRLQLKNTEVFVSLQSSATIVYVSGAVMRPGKILLDRPMTVLEAIMEAGGVTGLANLKKVVVVRESEGEHLTQTLDLSPALRGQKTHAFSLRAYDIIHVPERFF
jgi:protein involved in polysaccharide export with SLBB domain